MSPRRFRGQRHHHPVFEALEQMEEGFTTAGDGTTLCYQSFGEGPPLVFANGIGVRYPGLAMQIAHLRQYFRVITWDYRGTGRSELAHPDADVTMQAHASDLLAVLDATGVGRAVVVGWSMGCQVGLEAIRQRPGAVRGLVLLSGSYGRPFHDSALHRVAPALPLLWQTLARFTWPADLLLASGVGIPRLSLPLLAAVRFTTRAVTPAVFQAQMRCVRSADRRTYMRTLLELGRHDAFDVLPSITCPTLVVSCTRDYLTPVGAARRIAAAVPGAECVILEGLSHFGLIEDPDRVNRLLEDFARQCSPSEVGLTEAPATA